MTDAETYLRELRRALPVGCRRRFVAEVREHFVSAVAAEGDRGVGRADAERLTIERLGPADALAGQLLTDLRAGALGRFGRLSAAVTTPRLVAVVTALAVVVVAGAMFAGKHTSQAVPKQTRGYAVSIDPMTGDVRPLLVALQNGVQRRYSGEPLLVTRFWVPPTPVIHRSR